MGVLERREKEIKMTALKKQLLKSLGLAGVLSVGMFAPGIFKVMKSFGIDKKLKPNESYSYFRSLKRLEKDGLVSVTKRDGKFDIFLTEAGKQMLALHPNLKRRRWDKKWRILIFDIPNKRKGLRDKIRNKLLESGFLKIQDSVWVYPHNCEDFVTMLKAELRTGKQLLYLIVDQIEDDGWIKHKFEIDC